MPVDNQPQLGHHHGQADLELFQPLLSVNDAIFLVCQLLEFLLGQLVIPSPCNNMESWLKISDQKGLKQLTQ